MRIILYHFLQFFVTISGADEPLEKESNEYMDNLLNHYDTL